MLRVAAASHAPLEELLNGFIAHYEREVPHGTVLDHSLPEGAQRSFTRFCRVPVEAVQAMDLRARAPHLELPCVLRFRTGSGQDLRAGSRRARYAFCPHCTKMQRITHVPWQWALACITLCPEHHTPLRDGCPTCGEADPLTFVAPDRPSEKLCWSCTGDLTANPESTSIALDHKSIRAVEESYFAAISGTAPEPNLVGKTTDRAFRTFVACLLQILSTMLNPEAGWSNSFTADTALVSRRSLLRIITELISNAATTSDARERRHRTARSLSLWSTLLAFMTNYQGAEIEQASQHWPVTLRLRFEAALRHRKQKRWHYRPLPGACIQYQIKVPNHRCSVDFKCQNGASNTNFPYLSATRQCW
jgi:hypothetical protein